MTLHLDVGLLPREALFGIKGGPKVNIASIPFGLRVILEDMAKHGLIKSNEKGFGFAAATPTQDPRHRWNWDDPYDFTWFVAGWGSDGNRYIANAVRKLRAALREEKDTLFLRTDRPDAFRDKVESSDRNGYPWGDFPWGGATFVHVGDWIIPSAVSCYLEVEDDAAAKLVGGLCGAEILKISDPPEFGPNS